MTQFIWRVACILPFGLSGVMLFLIGMMCVICVIEEGRVLNLRSDVKGW